MKKVAILLALVMVLMIACVGCGSEEAATSEATVTEQPAATYTIDYGESNTYTKDDMDAAIEKIMAEFNTWGCEMHEIRYSEELTGTALEYINSLGNSYDQAIVFETNFHSPVETEETTAWELDTEYENYKWYLGRNGNGEWTLVTQGY